ncbi:hypothetical protein LTR78_000262 [Recurvomyces mirabilis]|uniref:Uncharacterized protein n=1 Tax=Recurvomyces mirabilis TaxID=574656 RepID=A0AAE0WWT2_9PEZI|nr:hypothetical protein LTR78_000262 [Recurvomyces mirabilis]KAK5161918.1 hypothetical protein LTS14_000263 [Recurvomyces mirabilis]
MPQDFTTIVESIATISIILAGLWTLFLFCVAFGGDVDRWEDHEHCRRVRGRRVRDHRLQRVRLARHMYAYKRRGPHPPRKQVPDFRPRRRPDPEAVRRARERDLWSTDSPSGESEDGLLVVQRRRLDRVG